jgi:hypothetical protein
VIILIKLWTALCWRHGSDEQIWFLPVSGLLDMMSHMNCTDMLQGIMTHPALILYLALKCARNFWWQLYIGWGGGGVVCVCVCVCVRVCVCVCARALLYYGSCGLRTEEVGIPYDNLHLWIPVRFAVRGSKWPANSISKSPTWISTFLSLLWYYRNHDILM